ncbi:hypothetical protein LXL04_011982 [Taraxacum kok-saghyz]
MLKTTMPKLFLLFRVESHSIAIKTNCITGLLTLCDCRLIWNSTLQLADVLELRRFIMEVFILLMYVQQFPGDKRLSFIKLQNLELMLWFQIEGLPTAKGRGMVEAGRGRSRWTLKDWKPHECSQQDTKDKLVPLLVFVRYETDSIE